MNKKNKKGSFSDILGVLVVVLFLILTVYFIELWHGYGITEVQSVLSNYEVTLLDRDIATATNVFEKTTLFFALQKTAKELGEHGGVPIDMNSSTIKDSADLNPQFSNEVYKWSFVDENNKNHKRIPFTYYKTHNYLLGTKPFEIKIENLNDAETTTNYLFVHIWMYESGNVEISCSSCTIEGTTKIEKTGKYFLEITNTGTLTFTGSKDNIATIKTIAISPYSGSNPSEFVDSLNEQLTNNLQENTNIKKEIKYNDVYSIFETDKDSTFLNGFLAPKNGIIGEITNPKLPKVTLQSFGETENLVNIRYWKIYNIVKDEIIGSTLYDDIETDFSNVYRPHTDSIKKYVSSIGMCSISSCNTLFSESGDSISDVETNLKNLIYTQITKLNDELNNNYNPDIKIQIVPHIIKPSDYSGYVNVRQTKNTYEDKDVAECNYGGCCKGSTDGAHWFECRKECEYDFGIDYRLMIKIIDKKYKIFDGTNWINYEYNAISEWIHLDDKIENELIIDIRNGNPKGKYKIASCGNCDNSCTACNNCPKPEGGNGGGGD